MSPNPAPEVLAPEEIVAFKLKFGPVIEDASTVVKT
jgi:hypothetical protein